MKVTNDIHYILLLLYPVRYLEQRLAVVRILMVLEKKNKQKKVLS